MDLGSSETSEGHTPGVYASGDRIGGKYLLLRRLTAGGMGTVWVARHLGLDVDVALKFVRADFSSPEASERLIREAQSLARLQHQAIVRVFDVGYAGEVDPYIV